MSNKENLLSLENDKIHITSLVHVILTGNAIEQENAITKLLVLSEDDVHSKMMVAAKCIPGLVWLCKYASAICKEIAAETLFNLSGDDYHEKEIVEAGAIPVLLELVKCGSDLSKLHATEVLFNLSFDVENGKLIVIGLSVLVNVIRSGTIACKENVARVLCNLASHDAENRKAIVAADGVAVLRDMSKFATNRVKVKVVSVLQCLCVDDEDGDEDEDEDENNDKEATDENTAEEKDDDFGEVVVYKPTFFRRRQIEVSVSTFAESVNHGQIPRKLDEGPAEDDDWVTVGAAAKSIKSNLRVTESYTTCDLLADSGLLYNSSIVIILVGLPGSGKSSISKRVLALNDPRWAVAEQDVLGNRQKTIACAKRHLLGGILPSKDPGPRGIVIDRCNFDAVQREHWVRLAKFTTECTGRRVFTIAVMLSRSNDADFCIERAKRRGNDGVHTGKEDWDAIVNSMSRHFHFPSQNEGIDANYWCDSSKDNNIDKLLSFIAGS